MAERLIPLDAASDWRDALGGIPHGFAHTWSSCHAMSLTSGNRTVLYEARHAETRVVIPLDERAVGPYSDVATPFGFSGFAGTSAWPEFPGVWSDFVRRRGYIAAYIGLNPVFGDDSYVRSNHIYRASDIYVLDLSLGGNALWRNLSQNRKRQLKRADQIRYETDHARLTAFFLDTYPRFMNAKDAARQYRFTPETLAAICELPNVLLIGAGRDGGIEGVSVFGYTPYAADYLLHAAVPGDENLSVPLLWSAVQRLIELKIPLLNLGGGLRSGDSLAVSKARFGGRRLQRCALKEIYDPLVYSGLCRKAGMDPAVGEGFFPAYRR